MTTQSRRAQPGRIRLLLVCQPLHGGVAQHVLDLVRSLPSDYDFDVVCPRASMLWRELVDVERVRLHPLGAGRRPGPGDTAAFLRLLRSARQADVVHAHSSKAGFLARLAAALTRRRGRTVFTPHCWSFWAAKGLERRLYVLVERLAAHGCAAIVTVSDDERRAGLAAGVGQPRQYEVVRNGIDLERFSGERDPARGRILMLGRLVEQKRPQLALEALAELERQAPGTGELYLAGDGVLEPELRELARELDIERSVVFLGARSDAPEQLARATCLLLTSVYEGCSIAVLEAMAAGVPVVAAAIGGIDEIVDDGVTGVVAPADPQALAAALRSVLEDPERATRLGEAGRRAARARFARSEPAERLDALYRRLAGAAG